jgi:hypothetical protein
VGTGQGEGGQEGKGGERAGVRSGSVVKRVPRREVDVLTGWPGLR